jgi:hypothetical protein
MEKAENLGGGWRLTCSSKLKELNFFPLDITTLDKAYTANHGELYHSFGSADEHLLQMKSNLRKHFVFTDLQLIEKDSDGIILYYDESVRRGAGTLGEAQYSYNLGIPIFIVNGFDNLSDIPGWLIALSTKIFSSFDELYDYLEKLPPQIIRRDIFGNHRSNKHYLCSLCGSPFIKKKQHFVSTVSPLYCSSCVDVVKTTFESHKDRYQFILQYLQEDEK